MDLRKTTYALMRSPDLVLKLRLADSYLVTRNRMPDLFSIPAEHAELKPIIDAFATDQIAFAEYIKAIRDEFSKEIKGDTYVQLNTLYRSIYSRAVQLVMRARVRKAVLTLLPELEFKLGRPVNYDSQQKVAKMLQRWWRLWRLDTMATERNSLSKKRLPRDDVQIVLDSFWTAIDKALAKGEVLLGPDHSIDEIAKELK